MELKTNSSFYTGLSGLVLPVPKYRFPPGYQHMSRLEYYATFFNSIEINSSFYKVPLVSTVRKWKEMVPDHFRFTYKLWKQITHCNGLFFEKADVQRFVDAISAAEEKKGCLLIQFPPKLSIDCKPQLQNLLDCLKTADHNTWKIAIEFRHRSWYDDPTYQLADDYDATIVIHDMPKSATPVLDLASDVIYLRFHGPTGNYRSSYSEDILSEYATYIEDWILEGKTVYAYFNNTAGDAFANAKELNDLL